MFLGEWIEYLLAALACGATGGVGSSYNFAAPNYHRLINAFARGDMESSTSGTVSLGSTDRVACRFRLHVRAKA